MSNDLATTLLLLTFLDDKLAAIPLFSIGHIPLLYTCLDYQSSIFYWRAVVQTCDQPVLLVVHRCWANQQHTWDDTQLYNLHNKYMFISVQTAIHYIRIYSL